MLTSTITNPQLQQLVVSGKLHCSKDEAAALAGIQLRIEESCPPARHHPRKFTPPTMHSNLRTIAEEFKESPPVSDVMANEASNPDTDEASQNGNNGDIGRSTPLKKSPAGSQTGLLWRRSGFLRQCMPIDKNKHPLMASVCLNDCVPPTYHNSKNMARLVKEQKRKLFHTSVYENEIQLKKLYIQTCKRLPVFGCQVYQVKELLRGKTKKKATRLLGIGAEKIVLLDSKTCLLARTQPTNELQQWRAGGGRSHDRLVLEFRGTKWSFVTPSASLKSITVDLWEIMQEMDNKFLDENVLPPSATQRAIAEAAKQRVLLQPFPSRSALYAEELDTLQRLLHFPEEVAFLLTETEHKLFHEVAPLCYVRHVTLDLSGQEQTSGEQTTVQALIKRFNELSSWVTHLIVSQPTHEDRKAVLSCMLRVALTCWNIGNFNASMEIVAGLRSDKLKPFWLSINEKEDRLRVMEFLTDALLTPQPSPQYEDAVQRALALPYCKVVPFFGHYLREIQAVFAGSPSMVVLCPSDSKNLEFVSDFHGEDHFMTRIGVGGLINVSKMESVLRVLRKVKWFHQHAWKLNKYLERKPSSCSSSLYDEPPRSNADSEYEVDLDVYRPIQPLNSDHGVSFIPLGRDPDLHTLQIMHHGTTVAHWDCDGSRLATVFLRLESSCATLTWCRPTWSALRGGGPPDYCLGAEPEVALTPGVILRYSGNETAASPGLEEGFLELSYVKEVVCGRAEVDLSAVERRLGLDTTSPSQRDCFSLVYGTNLSDNRVLDFVAPHKTAKLWFEGLVAVVRALHRQRKLSDQRLQWLREQYLQLYYSDGACMGPTPAEAINIFGGRKWTNGSQGSIVLLSEPLSSGFKKPSPFGMTSTKLRKKKSQTAIKELGSKSPQPPGTEEHKMPISPPTFRKSISSPPHSRPSHEEPIHRINTAPSFDTVEKFSYGGRDKPIRKHSGVSIGGEQSSHVRSLSITHSAQLDFEEFLELFRAFSLRTRRDLKELFEKIATTRKSTSDSSLSEMDQGKGQSGQNSRHHGLLTRVTADTYASHHRRKICDAFAVASIVANCTGVDTIRTKGILLEDFKNFLLTHQGENLTDEEVSSLIKRHEPDILLREQNCLSFEGFAQYLMDKDNYAFTSEGTTVKDDMDHPLSHYYTASSHNTYLTGHQLKGESSVELYSQVLLTGCRCVELDCWDGDDGMPLIYHGHTLTTKIPFKNVVEAINRSAFVSSPYPIILSIENHCSLQLQARMAQIFQSVFGEKLVSRFLFEGDFGDDPQLPTPNQLKYRILIKNKKLTVEPPAIMSFIQKQSKTKPTRNNSIVSNTSTASLNDDDDDDFDDDDDDDDLMDVMGKDLAIMSESLQTINGHDQEDKQSVGSLSKATSFEVRTESISSQEGFIKENLPSPPPQDDVEWKFDNITPKPKKQSTQIAQELSDLIIYTQAIKFRGLTPMSPTSSVKVKKGGAVKRAILPSSSSSPGTPPLGTELKLETTKEHTIRRQPSTASCYQVSSLNENHMKKLYRKHPLALIAHTERHLMRVYPAGMRIDSSNFNPIIFWAFGVQMVALNYQTEDSALHINTAMFEQNGGCGYVLKPRILWDKNHIMYRRFNPWDKEFDGLHCHCYTITVISGQYVCPGSYKSDSMSQPHTGNPQVEVEVTGIPNDCLKQKTRVVQRNALNPIWNETFIFKVMVGDFSFIKFSVYDVSTNHVTAQRVVPLRCLRPGYRHLRLRNSSNHPLPLSTLFIYSKVEEEWAGETQEVPRPIHEQGIEIGRAESKENASSSSIALKRRMFFLMVYGVIPEEPYTILKITQESTTRDVIAQALTKSGKLPDTIQDHILIEEVQRGWEKKDLERATTQRILAWDERPLEAQAQWQGEGRFILKKTGDDPSSRAWMSTIMGSAMKERRKAESSDSIRDWEYEETFHVCIHNVSPEIPYTILRAPISSTAQDVITQALVKARRLEDPSRFVLVEELDYNGQQDNTPVNKRRSRQIVVRTLADTESVYYVQTSWQVKGSIIMRERAEFPGDKKKSPSSRYASLGRFGKLRLSGSQKDKDRRLSMREREGRRREIGHWDHKANRARSDDGTGSFHDRYGASWGSSSTSKTTVEESEISVSPPTAVTSKQQQEMRVESCKASTDQSARQEGDPTDGEKGKKDPSADTSVPGTSRERQPIVAKLKKVSLQKLRGWR